MEEKTSRPHIRRSICVDFNLTKNFENYDVGENDKDPGAMTVTAARQDSGQ